MYSIGSVSTLVKFWIECENFMCWIFNMAWKVVSGLDSWHRQNGTKNGFIVVLGNLLFALSPVIWTISGWQKRVLEIQFSYFWNILLKNQKEMWVHYFLLKLVDGELGDFVSKSANNNYVLYECNEFCYKKEKLVKWNPHEEQQVTPNGITKQMRTC